MIAARQLDYFWMPIPDPCGGRGDRHAFRGLLTHYAEGEPCVTLCLEQVTFTMTGDWIWFPSCRKCWELAKELQGRSTFPVLDRAAPPVAGSAELARHAGDAAPGG